MQPRATTRRTFLGRAAGAAAGVALGADASLALGAGAPQHRLGFTSVTKELTLGSLPVEGSLPSWLGGTLVRNGPALWEVGERTFEHWFDGLAMLHAFSFGRGRVSYRNRFLRSSAYEAARTEGQIRFSEFATDPCRAIFNGAQAMFALAPVPNANVHVEQLGRRFVAHTELPLPVRFDPVTLRTLGVGGKTMPLGVTGTAHPHHTASGGRIAYEVQLLPPAAYVVRAGSRELGRVGAERPAYMHSFALTQRYAVLIEHPFTVDPLKFVTDWEPFIENFRWDGSESTRLHVVSLAGGKTVASVEVPAFFTFHNVNAFEDRRGRVVVDLLAYSDPSIVDALYLKRLRRGDRTPRARFRRFVLDVGRRRLESATTLSDARFELPRINYGRVNARPYRYAYGVALRTDRSRFLDQLVKVDVGTGEARTWREDGCFPGEAVFVPSPRAAREDDGVALSVVLDARRRTSFLLVLDARTFTERARAELPQWVPFGFHGAHFAA